MKSILLFTGLIIAEIFTSNVNGQNYEWAYTTAKSPATKVSTIRKDHGDNFYLATFLDTSSSYVQSELEKRDNNQQLLWNKMLTGDVYISDMEVNSSNGIVVIGYYNDSLTIDGSTIVNVGFDYSGFIFEVDENGVLQWLHDINPINQIFQPVDLFIAQDGFMYMTSEFAGVLNDFTAFHKLDLQGNIIKSEFNNNTEVRTYSNILADAEGNVYLSGTCGNFATFDTISSDVNFAYQNFVIKYDSSFRALWFHSREYITFDHNNSLETDGQSLYWAFVDFSNLNADTVKIVTLDLAGNILFDFPAPVPQSFFPGIKFSMDSTGTSLLALEVFSRLFLYGYDQAFNVMWEDTLMTGSSGFPFTSDIVSYDSTFYVAGLYYADTLPVGSFTLINPNQGANRPSDVFVTRWMESAITSIPNVAQDNKGLTIYPNPANDNIHFGSISNKNISVSLKIFDSMGREVFSNSKSTGEAIDISQWSTGVYFVTMIAGDEVRNGKFLKE